LDHDVSVNTHITISTSTEAPAVISSTTSSDETYVTTSQLSQLESDLLKEICAVAPQPQQHSQQEPLINILLKQIDFLQKTVTSLVNKIDLQSNTIAATNINKSPFTSPPVSENVVTLAAATTVTPSVSSAPKIAPVLPASPPTSTPVHTPPQSKKQFSRKQVLIVGDSMLNAIDETELRRDAFVRVRNHPGATVEDMIDHARAHCRNIKHDGVIIVAGTNDVSRNNQEENKNKPPRPTGADLSKLIKELKQTLPAESHIAVCQITARKDSTKAMSDVQKLNAEFKLIAEREHIGFVNTSQFTKDHTGRKGVHPNDIGLDKLHSTFEKYVRKISRL